MDDVDRLFQCFKCGISTPESAMRERKRLKRKEKNENPLNFSSPGSAELRYKDSSNAHISPDNKDSTSSIRTNKAGQRIKISPVVFYGSPNGVPPKRPSSLLRLLREIRVDLAEHRLKERKKIWVTFPRQEEAMKFATEHAQTQIFCYQDHFKGQRRFLVSTYHEFWRRYAVMDPMLRHHYEVIQEGLPCHLYFDLEFSKKHNLEKNEDEMVNLLLSVVFEALHDKYSIQGNLEWVIELDSSTEEKFSRHLIVRVPGAAFKDNSHVGAFIAEVCSRISSMKSTDKRYEKLFIRKDSSLSEPASHMFVDTAVYSRNRCFRLALSSKAGKTAFLVPTKRFMCKHMQSEEEMFMASLICKMDEDCEKFLVCKLDLDCAKTLQFDTEINANSERHYRTREFALNSCNYNSSATYLMGKSPFPELDKFIESVASTGSVPGQIRSWYWFSEHGLMVYSMSRNRYCERIGREHKSNHVIYVVDLYRDVYYQKCHDPECTGYRSPSRLVPDEAIPILSAFHNSGKISVQTGEPMGSLLYSSSGKTVESSPMDSWWMEATRIANDIESQPKTLDIENKEGSEEEDDEEWWVAVERTASLVEENTLVSVLEPKAASVH